VVAEKKVQLREKMLERIERSEDLESLIQSMPEGKNTKFLSQAHNLWYRFKNYDNHPPFVLRQNGEAVAFVFATYSDRSRYINLYEIVTAQGQEGKGYASEIWRLVMEHAHNSGMRRLKISCTPDSVTWHNRNGLIFWAVDPSGSLRSDQALFPSVDQQREYRSYVIENIKIGLPRDPKIINQFKRESLESHGFGAKKTARIQEAIQSVGDSWVRHDFMNECKSATLEKFI